MRDLEARVRVGRLFQKARGGVSIKDIEAATEKRFPDDKVPQTTIFRIERGEIERPGWADITKLALFYGIPHDQVLKAAGLAAQNGEPDTMTDQQREFRVLADLIRESGSEEALEHALVLLRMMVKHFGLTK